MVRSILALFLIFASLVPVFSEESFRVNADMLPEIGKLSRTDVVFRQFEEVVAWNDKISSDETRADQIEMEFYSYTPSAGEDLLSVSAASGIPYDTIGTLNSLPDMSSKIYGKKLVLPAVKGVFVMDKPCSAVEILVAAEFSSEVENSGNSCYYLGDKKIYFLSGKRFTPSQRAFFLDTSLRMPLDKYQVSSGFGYRNSPVYNRWKFHKGIDLAASEGTAVFACKGGKVALCVRLDPVFGNYLVISHENGLSSVYAHLSKMKVSRGDVVHKGDMIGFVGQTGAVTGPHLHFEIRQNGVAADPADFLEY